VIAPRQHAGLSPERWAAFPFAQQILMIGNEMNRGLAQLDARAWDRARSCHERVLQLVDLTAGSPLGRSRRRELLRWRDLVAALYVEDMPSIDAHKEAFRCLLRFTPESSVQLGELPGLAGPSGSQPGAQARRTIAGPATT
jgi:hypothetical protein